MLQQSVLEGMKNETIFKGTGYTGFAILYSCFTVTNIFAPAFVTFLEPAVAMFIGAIPYLLVQDNIRFAQTFFQTVYGTCIGHYVKYGPQRKRLIGLHGFLLGAGEIIGDSALNTQLMNILAGRYKDTSASAFAIFKLVQSLVSAIAFSYSGVLSLQYQLLIIVTFLFISTPSLVVVLFDDKVILPVAQFSTLSAPDPTNVEKEELKQLE
ncbi:unnamed protein product [Didymodactylos carnosus]|uniref:Uncharacterized protein n=1 Tax=Didymodactylos carnosus TaxID=1234261 RepID=A0A814WD25_9BILA|nr:unnamed protein product [Didymodactylos carnosus]CAF1247820.1 unnamed protein product [Didymodactylos carnosus]CAF3965080.1 unnamed protein product [Didymodactylos carnosus]CAF4055422.1 unnamed protein product [Didymodactylos carnosus]